MQRTITALGAAVAAGSMWLATAPIYAAPAYATPAQKPPTATLRIMPQWTYSGGGEFAVTTKCSAGKDSRVIFSRLLYRPVVVPGAGNLLIRVTGRTKPGKYAIGLECVDGRQADAVTFKTVTVRKQLPGWGMTSPPALPRNFKPNLIVATGVRQVIVSKPRLIRHAPVYR